MLYTFLNKFYLGRIPWASSEWPRVHSTENKQQTRAGGGSPEEPKMGSSLLSPALPVWPSGLGTRQGEDGPQPSSQPSFCSTPSEAGSPGARERVSKFPDLPLLDPGEPTLAPQRRASLERARTAQASSLPSGPCVELRPPDTPAGVRSRPAAPAPRPTVPPSPTRARVWKVPLVSRHGGRPRREDGATTAPPPD